MNVPAAGHFPHTLLQQFGDQRVDVAHGRQVTVSPASPPDHRRHPDANTRVD